MGVFNVSSVNEGFDYTPSELDTVNADNIMMAENFAQMAIMDAAEYIQEHSDLVRAMGAQEISITESGQEVIYEASTIGGIGEKIKNLLKKFLAKIKELFSKAIAVFRSWFQSDKEFIHTYSKTFMTNWVKVKKLKVKAYKYHDAIKKFTPLAGFDENEFKNSFNAIVDAEISGSSANIKSVLTSSTITTEAIANAVVKDINSVDSTDFSEKVRGIAFKVFNSSGSASYSAKEFSEDLYEFWRDGDSSKDTMDKSELESNGYSSANIISTLQNGEKSLSNIERDFRKIEKASNKFIKENIDKPLKNATKFDSKATTEDNAIKTAVAAVYTLLSSFASTFSESIHTGAGIYFQLCKEYSRTCKSIATKVVAMGEKRLAQEESYDFGNDDGYATSYMNAVVIK